jgi:16S rRNA (guanine527-N7)-methyltransferase
MSAAKLLESGLQQLDLPYTPEQLTQLLAYVKILEKWNRVFNLIGTLDRERLVNRHILDSLSCLAYVKGKTVLDAGSGAGLPGIPLAILRPELNLVLLDSNGKKTRFLQQAVMELGLADRVKVVKSRIEEYRPGQPFDTVVSRAFAGLGDFVASSLPLCDQQTVLLAMKGRLSESELNTLNPGVKVLDIAAIKVPGVEAERHIVCLQKTPD